MSDLWCGFCGEQCHDLVRDPEAVSWLGAGAPVFCSQRCMDARQAQEINAAGNQ